MKAMKAMQEGLAAVRAEVKKFATQIINVLEVFTTLTLLIDPSGSIDKCFSQVWL